MPQSPTVREPHPCVRRCGHADHHHVRTPELEGAREIVLWCAGCRRHEVRTLGWFASPRRNRLGPTRALPLRAN